VKQKVFWVLLLALGLRVGAALSVHTYLESAGREFLIPGDAAGYWELGQKLAAGEDYTIYSPERQAMRMSGLLSGLDQARRNTAAAGSIVTSLRRNGGLLVRASPGNAADR